MEGRWGGGGGGGGRGAWGAYIRWEAYIWDVNWITNLGGVYSGRGELTYGEAH